MLQHPLEKKVMSSRTFKNQIFFGSQVARFSGDPSQFSTGSYVFFFKEATCGSSTINGLIYAHETLIVAWRYDVHRDWLWDACHMAGVHWRSCCKGFFKQGRPALLLYAKCKEHDNQPNSGVGNPLGIPSRAVLRSLAGLMSRKEVSVQGFLWVKKVWFAFAQRTFTQETFGKRQKASYFEKALHAVHEIWGRMYGVLPHSAKGTRNGMRNRIPVQPRKGAIKLVSSDYAKILEYKSSD